MNSQYSGRMKKIITVVLGLLIYSAPLLSQIYYKEVVYTFHYTIEKENVITQKGVIYLGCLGKSWPFKEQKQAAVIWTTHKEHLDKKLISTGIYEEEDAIWMHPPREDEFAILEYSPFPYIRFPVSAYMSWKRDFTPGRNWINKKYGIQAESVLKFDYKNSGTDSFRYKNRVLECWKIDAESVNLKSKTRFSGLFNSEYGFVRMMFQNIDKSVIILELDQVQGWESFRGESFLSSFYSHQT